MHPNPNPNPKRRKLVSTGECCVVQGAVVRCKRTKAFADAYRVTTLVAAREMNRKLGTPKWYCLGKSNLVAHLVVNRSAETIQRFLRRRRRRRRQADGVCPISLVPVSQIPLKRRFRHLNTCFDTKFLALHMVTTSDFANPVTRVEFREEDVRRIDPGLIEHFRNRKRMRASLKEDMAIAASVENEMEDVFHDMVDAAREIPSKMEFRMVFDDLAQDFQQCHADLVEIDRDRSSLALKSLGDFIRGDPGRRAVHMSKKREGMLWHFLKCQRV